MPNPGAAQDTVLDRIEKIGRTMWFCMPLTRVIHENLKNHLCCEGHKLCAAPPFHTVRFDAF